MLLRNVISQTKGHPCGRPVKTWAHPSFADSPQTECVAVAFRSGVCGWLSFLHAVVSGPSAGDGLFSGLLVFQ